MKKEKLSPQQMEQRILELEAQLRQEQMRTTVLDKMIDLAEQDLKISIRKKSGANRRQAETHGSLLANGRGAKEENKVKQSR